MGTRCASCGEGTALLGLLCRDCAARLATPVRLCPEQIVSSSAEDADAALIDAWGRPHNLAERTSIGRKLEHHGIAVLDGVVSRAHAELTRDTAGRWHVRDLDSTNGTFVGDHPVAEPTPLASGDTLFVGQVGFFFVTPAPAAVAGLSDDGIGATVKPSDGVATLPGEPDADDDETTLDGLPELPIAIVTAGGGGGGYLQVDDKLVQLTDTQLTFVEMLVDRMRDESSQPELVRGFVRSAELLVDLPWNTAHPSDNHVKQLVRRVRRALARADVSDLIESRHRLGYRLRAIPLPPRASG